jgi:hypothetical protein
LGALYREPDHSHHSSAEVKNTWSYISALPYVSSRGVKLRTDKIYFLHTKLDRITVLWHIDPLLGNDHDVNNETMAAARQQFRKYTTLLEPLRSRDSPAGIPTGYGLDDRGVAVRVP